MLSEYCFQNRIQCWSFTVDFSRKVFFLKKKKRFFLRKVVVKIKDLGPSEHSLWALDDSFVLQVKHSISLLHDEVRI